MKTAFAAGGAIQTRYFMLVSNYLELHILQVGGNRMMRFSLPTNRRRLVRLLGAGVLVTGGACMPILLAGSAQALACGTAPSTAFPDACTFTGTLTVGAGVLSLTTPGSLTWAAGLTGVDQEVVDAVTADQIYTVDDATGAAAGWNVTVAATTFTNGTATLPDGTTGAPTFATNGDLTAEFPVTGNLVDPTVAPTAACSTGATCVLPTTGSNATTYPVSILTAAAAVGGVGGPTAYVIYSVAAASGGLGSIDIGGSTAANPVAWWLNVPADAALGAYASTIVVAVNSGP